MLTSATAAMSTPTRRGPANARFRGRGRVRGPLGSTGVLGFGPPHKATGGGRASSPSHAAGRSHGCACPTSPLNKAPDDEADRGASKKVVATMARAIANPRRTAPPRPTTLPLARSTTTSRRCPFAWARSWERVSRTAHGSVQPCDDAGAREFGRRRGDKAREGIGAEALVRPRSRAADPGPPRVLTEKRGMPSGDERSGQRAGLGDSRARS